MPARWSIRFPMLYRAAGYMATRMLLMANSISVLLPAYVVELVKAHADREQVFAEFVRYYLFKAVDLTQNQVDADRLTFINKTLEGLPPKLRDLALAHKVVPFQVADGDSSA